MAGDGRMKKNPSWNYDQRMRPAVMPRRKIDVDEMKKNMTKHGKGLRMSGDKCEMCGGSMNDNFLFADQAL